MEICFMHGTVCAAYFANMGSSRAFGAKTKVGLQPLVSDSMPPYFPRFTPRQRRDAASPRVAPHIPYAVKTAQALLSGPTNIICTPKSRILMRGENEEISFRILKNSNQNALQPGQRSA
jgi:hypothetical protein